MATVVGLLQQAGCNIRAPQPRNVRETDRSLEKAPSFIKPTWPSQHHVQTHRPVTHPITHAGMQGYKPTWSNSKQHHKHLLTARPGSGPSSVSVSGDTFTDGSELMTRRAYTANPPPFQRTSSHSISSSNPGFPASATSLSQGDAIPNLTTVKARNIDNARRPISEHVDVDVQGTQAQPDEQQSYYERGGGLDCAYNGLSLDWTSSDQTRRKTPIEQRQQVITHGPYQDGNSPYDFRCLDSQADLQMHEDENVLDRPATAPTQNSYQPEVARSTQDSTHSGISSYKPISSGPASRSVMDRNQQISVSKDWPGGRNIPTSNEAAYPQSSILSNPSGTDASRLPAPHIAAMRSFNESTSVLQRSPLPKPSYGVSTASNRPPLVPNDNRTNAMALKSSHLLHHARVSTSSNEQDAFMRGADRTELCNDNSFETSRYPRKRPRLTNPTVQNLSEGTPDQDEDPGRDISNNLAGPTGSSFDLSLEGHISQPVHERRLKLEEKLLQLLFDKDFQALCEDVEASATRIGFNA